MKALNVEELQFIEGVLLIVVKVGELQLL